MSLIYYLNLLKNILSDLNLKFKHIQSISRNQTKFPKSKIYRNSKLENSTLDPFSIVFINVTLFNTKLGSHSYVQKNSTIINCEIGKFCSIASNVTIGPGIHLTSGVSTHPAFYLQNTPLIKKYSSKDLFISSVRSNIGNDVWIGEKSIILDGLTIGDGAIIAAGSIVNSNVEPYSIVGGIPAKHIKFRFDEQTRIKLLELKWWNKSEEWLERNYKSFQNVNELLEI